MTRTGPIQKDILIEDLIDRVPRAIPLLMRKRIRCLMCGEPIWGTLEEAAREKGYDDIGIAAIVEELNALAREGGETP